MVFQQLLGPLPLGGIHLSPGQCRDGAMSQTVPGCGRENQQQQRDRNVQYDSHKKTQGDAQTKNP
jgi:hypothetical protein